jgi:hypothetical protein
MYIDCYCYKVLFDKEELQTISWSRDEAFGFANTEILAFRSGAIG